MLPDAIRTILLRDLGGLIREVAAYPDDEALWRLAPGISNPAGTLALHLAGNLEHFVGAVLGHTGFVRDRDAEFTTRGLTRAQLRTRIETAMASVDSTLSAISAEQCRSEYPVPVGGRRVRTAAFLVHLATHLAYHLGQIDYHRRLLDPHAKPVDALSIAGLPEITD